MIRVSAIGGYEIAKTSHLCMVLFNVSTAGLIFSHKVNNLTCGILGLYFLLKLVFVQPTVSLLFFILAVDGTGFYTVMWDNASLIPEMIRDLKAETDVVASSAAKIMDRAYFRCVSRSIPNIGVKVGGFRNIERDSTLIFVGFVFNNVVSLLISV